MLPLTSNICDSLAPCSESGPVEIFHECVGLSSFLQIILLSLCIAQLFMRSSVFHPLRGYDIVELVEDVGAILDNANDPM